MGWLREAAEFALTVGGAALSLAAVALLAAAGWRAWKQSRRTDVIIETLADATGDAATAAAALGLTYRLRERVVTQLPKLADHAKRSVERAADDSTSPIRTLMGKDIEGRNALLGDITSSQKDLVESMESMVPQAARGAYRVVANSLLRPKEVRVLGVLQRVSDASGGVGISLTVNHVGAEEAASRITVWEDEDCDISNMTVVERFHALTRPAARAVACELLRQRLRVRMSERRTHRRRPHRDEKRQADEAVVEFLVGGAYQNAAHGSKRATKSFFHLAKLRLQSSAEHLDHFKLSFQLANTLAELGRRQGADREKAIDLLSRSTRLFEEAGTKLPAAGLHPVAGDAEKLRIQTALTMNACLLAELLPDDDPRAKQAAALARALGTVDPARYEAPGVFYNVACALAVAARVEGLARHGSDRERCLEQSRVWLLHAGARNDQWWTQGTEDPDLCMLRDWIPVARRRLWESSIDANGQGSPDAQTVADRIVRVMETFETKVADAREGAPRGGAPRSGGGPDADIAEMPTVAART